MNEHRALVEAGLLRDDGVVEVEAVARAPGLDAQHLGGRLGHRARRRPPQRSAHAADSSAAQKTSTPRSVTTRTHRPRRPARRARSACSASGSSPRRRPARIRPDQRQQAALQRALVQLDVEPELVAPDHVEELLQRDALAVEQQLVAEVEHAQVALHLALVVEERRVAARARARAPRCRW